MEQPWTTDEVALLSPYVSDLYSPVFALRNLPEEVVAVLFAYYSRSRATLRRNLLGLLKDQELAVEVGQTGGSDLAFAAEKARQFHEKWVVGYGHASVAEHAVVHLALEDISIVASKVVEDMRLASFTEKSTRYVQFERGSLHIPQALVGHPLELVFRQGVDHLFDTYTRLIEPMTAEIVRAFPADPGSRPKAVEAACRARALDALRCLLPAATLTNVGLTLNGRAAAHLIAKLRSHPLEECRQLGDSLQHHAQLILPSLVKYAEARPYLRDTPLKVATLAGELLGQATPEVVEGVTWVQIDPRPEDELVAAILYRHVDLPLLQVKRLVLGLTEAERERVIDTYLKDRGPWDAPLRELEHVFCTVDILLDYGAFRDIQRHRMATQTPQALGMDHGWVMPEEFKIFGMEEHFEQAMAQAEDAWRRIREQFPAEATYVVPLASRIRVCFTWNLRELFHFIELRSAPQGHRSYRRVAQALWQNLAKRHPLLARYCRVTQGDVDLGRLQAEERAEARREAQAKGLV